MNIFIQAQSEQPRRFLKAWSLLSEVQRQVLPRALISCAGGILLALLGRLVHVSVLGYAEMIVACSFWVAAFMIVTFRGHIGRMLLWLLLLETSLQLYQLSIYMAVRSEYPLLRLGPVFLGGTLLVICTSFRTSQRPILYVVWIACNLPALVSACIQGYLNSTDAFVFYGANSFYPLVFYYAAGCIGRTAMPQHILKDSISLSMPVLCSIPLLLMPVELSMRETTSVALLQFGRSYSVMGAILLTWPIWITSLGQMRLSLRLASMSLIFLVFLTSFSRGGLVILLAMLVGTSVLDRRKSSRFLKTLILVFFILLGCGLVFLPGWMGDAAHFWLLRLNIANNLSSGLHFTLDEFLQTDRYELWDIAVKLFKGSPLWGYGIGSSPFLNATATYNQFSFSGMHNLFLTVLVERGLIGLTGLLVLIGRVAYLISTSHCLPAPRTLVGFSFLMFLIFCNTTGVELFLNSTRSMNVTITVYLFLIIGFLEYRIGMEQTYIPRKTVRIVPSFQEG